MAPQYSTQIAVASALVGASTILGYYYYKKLRQNRIPKEWEPVGTVSELYMYPLKSGRRLEITNAKCTEYGLQSPEPSLPHFRDRCLVIYKENANEVKSARTYPNILLIETSTIGNEHFSLNAPGMDALMLPVPKVTGNEIYITMWNKEQIFTIDCGEEAAQWVSNYILGQSVGLRLGYHDGQHRRDIEKYYQSYKKIFPNFGNFAGGMYSDLATVLLLTKSSVTDLEKRIPEANISLHNFRPNIVVDGDKIKPYDEDNWKWIKIGDVIFQNVMLCNRCSMTTVNPETAQFLKNYEPIKTMNQYRSSIKIGSGPQSPNMGIYVGMRKEGNIKVNDTVYVGKS
ncbi:hypothetical protein RN001_004034 [Aquatica leii]|uniref:MOSC domain-containing protein n=1 Tax=Aquatica leii TaxID=1421715 RepID=A0AAN7QPF0_9COLE|nr:hypothetical protein RN001_004034 [Aquatica leii]